MGILSIQPANPGSQPRWENTGHEPRRPRLQKTSPTPVPSPHRCLPATGRLREQAAVGRPVAAKAWGLWRRSPRQYILAFLVQAKAEPGQQPLCLLAPNESGGGCQG